MLFDPRHDKTPSMAGFALYCASKPVNEAYHWPNCNVCAVGQYLQSIEVDPIGFTWDGEIETMNKLARGGRADVYYDVEDWTFGKLCDRILQYQMSIEKV